MRAAGGLVLGLALPASAKPGLVTPAQTEGPFYPLEIAESDADLTRLKGRTGRAQGREVLVKGKVRNLDGQPISGAKVELWQACASGRYNHPRDPNTAPWDDGFQGYAQVITDKLGRFRFRTIEPGAYPAAQNWMRPPHLHFKVRAPGYAELTTQMYFEGHKLNAKDYIISELTPAQRELVVVRFAPLDKVATGNFEVIMGHLGRYSGMVTPFLN